MPMPKLMVDMDSAMMLYLETLLFIDLVSVTGQAANNVEPVVSVMPKPMLMAMEDTVVVLPVIPMVEAHM